MDATIIAGSLDDKELRKSIDDLVKYVDNQTHNMASNFVVAMNTMKGAMKDFAITQKVSVATMQEAWRKMSTSFDAMVAAQTNATGSGNNSGSGGGNSQYADNTVGHLQEIIALEEKRRKEMTLGSDALRDQNKLIADQKQQLKDELMTEEEKRKAIEKQNEALERQKSKQLKKAQSSYLYDFNKANTEPSKDIASAEQKLRNLKKAVDDMRKSGLFDEVKLNKAQNAIDSLEQKIERMRSRKPMTLNEVIGMDESSLEAITAKMRALKRVQLDPQNANQVKQLGNEYQRLKRLQAELMGQNIQMTHSNNYLAQSFGYIRNRIVYALTLGALSQFTKQMFAVRGEYEMLERSLGVLVNSFEKGSQIFQELNEMAIKSPFTLVELGTAAKQLTAYNFAANEVVDTTRRLADISAALGVPMERLTYNLGQIKAQGVLNARDARDFANAGLAIVPMLAQLYTEQKRFGEEMVTTAQVYDMMSKKLVSYSDVLSVLYKITDDGGKFFDFQAKQAETLKVQMNNLTLAMNNMYNEIGASNQGLLVGTVQVTKKIFENWKTVLSIIQSLIVTYGAYKAILAIVNATHMRTWGARMIIGITQYINAIRSATGAMATFNAVMSSNAIVAFSSALLGVASYFLFFRQSVNKTTVDIERFGESGAKAINNIETLGRIIKGVDENTSLYKKTVGELNQILNDYGLNEIKNRDEINGKIEKTIELIKEESAARNRANMLARGQETFAKDVKSANEELSERLKSSLATTGVRKELNKNVDIITSVIGDIVQENISLIANKTGDEYEKSMKEIFDIIEERMRRIGISGETIEQQLSYKTQFNQTNFANIRQYINAIAKANQTLDDYNNKTEANYRAAKKATQSTMSMAEKINYNANAMKNASQDAVSLYNRVYEIVKLAQENHIINFDLKLTAENPPKWMMNMDLPKLQELAARFTAIAQSGGRAKGYTQETTYERGLLYASAARQKQYEEERKALEDRNKKDGRSGRKDEDIVAEALKQELQLIKEMQSNYDKLRKSGVSNMDAIDLASKGYEATIIRINQVLSKFGIDKFNAANFAGKDVRSLLQSLEEQRNALLASGKVKTSSLQALDVEIQKLTVDAKTYDMKKVTDGLNSELGKIKDEYELAIELDANPELANMFVDMFGIDKNELANSFGDALSKAQKIVDEKLSKEGLSFDIIRGDIEQFAKTSNKEVNSDLVKTLASSQKTLRNMFKSNLVNTEKFLDEYVKKYGDYSDKIAEIEAERLRLIKELNNAYYDENMRNSYEYTSKLNAINMGAQKKAQQVEFEDFKDSRYYTMIFENLDYISTKTIRDMRDKVRELINTMNELTPEQIKTLISQYEKLEQKLAKRNPFKTAAKNITQSLSETKARRNANNDFREAQKAYDRQKHIVASIKKEVEQRQHNNTLQGQQGQLLLLNLKAQDAILKNLQQQLEEKALIADKYNLTKKLAQSEAVSIASMVSSNLSSLGELRDFIQDEIGWELSEDLNVVIDGFMGINDGIKKIVSSAESGDIVGIVTGVAKTFYSLYDTMDKMFGGGNRNKRIDSEIEESRKAVEKLKLAYEALQDVAEKAYGALTIGAKRATISNKQLQLAEIERQLSLEKSRDAKHVDNARIMELESEWQSLVLEIKNGTKEIVNNMLGISSSGDGITSLVDSMVQAFKNGENAMEAFGNKWDEMIDNMTLKLIVTKYMQTAWDSILKTLNDKEEEMMKESSDAYADAQKQLTEMQTMNQYERAWYYMEKMGIASINWGLNTDEGRWALIHAAEDYMKGLESQMSAAEQASIEASEKYLEWSLDYMTHEGKDRLTDAADNLSASLGDFFKQDVSLSNLQQGIQSITETTAGAIEAYMNIVAQRVFEQNTYLQEIRDHLNNFDLDVQLGTLSQMLLQLQQSYQVQQNIESILTGVLNPSGRAIVVELNS